IVCCRIGSKTEVVWISRVAEIVQNHTGLNTRETTRRVYLENVVHVLRHVHNHGDIAALTCETRATAARQDRRAELSRDGDGFNDVAGIARQHGAYRDLAIVGCVGGIQGPASVIESDLSLDAATQCSFEIGGVVDLMRITLHIALPPFVLMTAPNR